MIDLVELVELLTKTRHRNGLSCVQESCTERRHSSTALVFGGGSGEVLVVLVENRVG